MKDTERKVFKSKGNRASMWVLAFMYMGLLLKCEKMGGVTTCIEYAVLSILVYKVFNYNRYILYDKYVEIRNILTKKTVNYESISKVEEICSSAHIYAPAAEQLKISYDKDKVIYVSPAEMEIFKEYLEKKIKK